MAEKKNTANKNNDNAVAALCFFALFALLIVTAIFSSSHPLDFMVEMLTKVTAYIFVIAGVCLIAMIFWHYWKLASVDPEKTIAEATRDNLEYSKDVTADISSKVQNFYTAYKQRVKEAEKNNK
jgi:hypothetical protein